MRVLIVRVGALGDVLHALPAVAALRIAEPGWHIDWVVDSRWQPLLVNSEGVGPVVNRVHLADTKLWSRAPFSLATARSILSLRRDLRSAHYDIAIDMQGTLRSAVIARLSRAPVRAGYSDPREPQAAWFYTHKLPRLATHVVEQGIHLLSQALEKMLGAPLVTVPSSRVGYADVPRADGSFLANSPGAPSVTVSPSRVGGYEDALSAANSPSELPHEAWADAWAAEEIPAGRRVALLAPGAGWAAKQWPAAKFGALARELRNQGFDVVVSAPGKENQTALNVIAASGPTGSPTARMVVSNIAGLVALTRRAALLIGGDSGPTHLAAALGVPLVALFGPTDPARNGPYGNGPRRMLRHPSSITSYKHTAAPDPALARISVEEVFQAALEVSSKPPLSPGP